MCINSVHYDIFYISCLCDIILAGHFVPASFMVLRCGPVQTVLCRLSVLLIWFHGKMPRSCFDKFNHH